MTEFMKKVLSVPMQGDESYRDNWERTFGKKDDSEPETVRDPVTSVSDVPPIAKPLMCAHCERDERNASSMFCQLCRVRRENSHE